MSRKSDELISQALESKKNGHFEPARTMLAEAIELLREDNDPLVLAQALRDLGEIERLLADTDGGIAAYEQAVAIFRQQGAELRLAHTIRHLADIQRKGHLLDDANRNYQIAVDLYRKHPDASTLDVANALRGQALLKEARGETGQAIALWSEATTLYRQADISNAVEEGHRRLARLREKQ